MKYGLYVFIFCCLLAATGASIGDVLLIDSIHDAPVNSTEGVSRPTRGMSMDQVKRNFGEPQRTHPQVGDPPITRWDYPDYSVYFEYQHVLTSVVHQL